MKLKKIYDKVFIRLLTGTEAAEKAADKAEKNSKMPGKQMARTNTPEDNSKDISNTPPLAGESQGGTAPGQKSIWLPIFIFKLVYFRLLHLLFLINNYI